MSQNRRTLEHTLPWAELAGFLAAAATLVFLELRRHPEYLDQPLSIFAYTPNHETTWVGLALLAAPLVWRFGGRPNALGFGDTRPSSMPTPIPDPTCATPSRSKGELAAAWLVCVCLLAVHVSLTWWVGRSFQGMPPAYHDEFSYLFQARTFLAGRLYFPQHSLPEFFDQMHVLNDDGIFASRYFPGVGLWLAPWLAIGWPYGAQVLAGGLIVVCVFWIGRELACAWNDRRGSESESNGVSLNTVATLGAAFCALTPAMSLFGNLLLSHHPTTLGLVVFVLCFLRAIRSHGVLWPLAGGMALSFAMLCRPLTAFGFALPFGVYLVWLVARGQLARPVARLAAALIPLVVGIASLGAYNLAITGSPIQSPYGRYTKLYTPSHRYGFHKTIRVSEVSNSRIIKNYDQWAEDLTVSRAIKLTALRADASAFWSVGRMTLAYFVAAFLILWPQIPGLWRLVAASVLGLHVVYFPFGFEGIFNLSYVFESVPVLCLLAGGVGVVMVRQWVAKRQWARALWLGVFVLLGLVGVFDGLIRPGPDGGIAQVRFARRYYARFDAQLLAAGVRPPAIVFIDADPADRHLDLVTNSPILDDPILRVRNRRSHNQELLQLFPDREPWIYDAKTGRLSRSERSRWGLPD